MDYTYHHVCIFFYWLNKSSLFELDFDALDAGQVKSGLVEAFPIITFEEFFCEMGASST